ncbi:hypothetical protein PVK62_16905 [Aliivibrio sp. S3MY1]|uniref:hypothetical protein n=1 Tax=unclassified Aliivibrio TaxID=2645654 RepID=UPI002379CC81|nr:MULTISPECIES: hypothetical protein [unclassified Aliivibrio]MDD9197504.1 hypothetical protein [Aliivibrio sp. S3MY1]MDD9200763.1 hypothetical protein [Aliivibrio sp. S2MY1]
MEQILKDVVCWFSYIYEGNAEKAQLISILISSILAVIALIANQWIIRRTARNELMLDKCERGYNLAVRLNVLSMEWISSVINQDETSHLEFKAQFTGAAQALEGVCSLYFDDIDFDKEVIEKFSMVIFHNRKSLNIPNLMEIQSEMDNMLRSVRESFKGKNRQYQH